MTQTNGGPNGNRQANQEVHGSSDQGTGGGAGTSFTSTFIAGTITYSFTNDRASGSRAGLTSLVYTPLIDQRIIPNEGIVVGEITAWRIWRVDHEDKILQSYAMENAWRDGTMEGRPEYYNEGVYAFKKEEDLPSYILNNSNQLIGGRVKLWGKIVEHEKGYRAQYAKITHLDYGKPKILKEYRKIYGVEGKRIWPKQLKPLLIICLWGVAGGVFGWAVPDLLNWLFS